MRSALIWLRLDALMKKRIPTILGLGVLLIGVAAGVLLVGQGTGGFLPRANEEAIPQQVRITNITESGFTVSFITQVNTLGLLEYGTEAKQLKTKVLDDRDQLSGESGQYRTHHITVTGLQPSTQYYFRIGTASRNFFDNQGEPFAVRTSRPGLTPTSAPSASGQVRTQAGSPANGSLIYLTAAGASPLSAYIKQDGSWSIPLSQMRTQDLSAIVTLDTTTEIKIQVIGTDGETLNAAVQYGQLGQLATLQFGQDTSALGQGVNTTDTSVDDTTINDPTLPSGEDTLGNLLDDEDRFGTLPQSGITIVYPQADNEVISATKPELSGNAPPNSVLQIEVHSDEAYYDVVESDANGNWAWSPPADLEAGEHSVTIRYTDENGVQQEETRTFIVQANSTYPSFVSTPSGQLSSPSPTPTLRPSPSPSPVVSPTPTPSPTPTLRPTPSPFVSYPATSAAQPVTASSGPLWLLAAGAFFFGGLGMVWWLVKPAQAERGYGQPFT